MSWEWFECEDFEVSTDDVDVFDDWGSAAYRAVRMNQGTSIGFRPYVNPGGQWQITLRVQKTSDTAATVRISAGGASAEHTLENTEGNASWEWKSLRLYLPAGPAEVWIEAITGSLNCDGFFLHSEHVEKFEKVEALQRFVGQAEAQQTTPQKPRTLPPPPASRATKAEVSPIEVVRAAAGDRLEVIEALARKHAAYIVKAHDTAGGTDYNADYTWHLLHKEKLWDFAPHSAAFGALNPNTDLFYTLGISVDGGDYWHKKPDETLAHLVDMVICRSQFENISAEFMIRCHDSNTLHTVVWLTNTGQQAHIAQVGEALSKGPLTNPPPQRYTRPEQKFGYGVETTAGGVSWQGASEDGRGAGVCFYEWIRNRSRGRRLFAAMQSDIGGAVEFGRADTTSSGFAVLYRKSDEILLQPGESKAVNLSLNLRRFTLHDDWTPELTPELYKKESEEAAVARGFLSASQAIGTRWAEAIQESVRPYLDYPIVKLPELDWDSGFYSCIEYVRALTFSPLGDMARPFYNFCRAHAHDPFNWWSYGMHAHENLFITVQNYVDPKLSADFLRGHIDHQTPEGRYPYGVSHTTCSRTRTEEATLPALVWEMWLVYLWSGDRSWLEECYPSAVRNHQWYLETRDRCGEGLCHYINFSYETSRDDNGLPTWVVTGGAMYQEALDLNCFLLMQEQVLSSMAEELGLAEDAAKWSQMAARRAKQMNAWMWHDEDRCYYGIGEVIPGWANVRDISTFYPLWCGLAPDGRHEPIARLASDPDTFGTPYGPPTLAADEPMFSAEGHWFGGNWPEVTLLALLGLQKYGYYSEAARLAHQNVKMVFDDLARSGHFREYFNSVHGNGTDLVDYNWTAVVGHFIGGIILGIQPEADGLSILPALPEGWKEAEIRNLLIRGKKVTLWVRRDETQTETSVTLNGHVLKDVEGRGAFIAWKDLPDEAVVEIQQPMAIPDHPSAPESAPRDWSDMPEHEYPDDPELIQQVRSSMISKEELWRNPPPFIGL